MRKKSRDTRHKWRNKFIKFFLVTLTTVAIVGMLPSEKNKTHDYEIGKPWKYPDFIAKFQFNVYKSEEALKHEKDSLSQAFEPYYDLDEKMAEQQIERFKEEYSNRAGLFSGSFVNAISLKLHDIYEHGVVDNSTYDLCQKDSTKHLRLINGKTATRKSIAEYYTPESAKQFILNNSALAQVHSILDTTDIIAYIKPNILYNKKRTESEKKELLNTIAVSTGVVYQGQKIIDRGDVVTQQTYTVLKSYEKEMERQTISQSEQLLLLSGQFIFVFMLVVLFTFYLELYRSDYFDKPRSIIMLYMLLTIFPIMVSTLIQHNFMSIYILPMTMAPMFIRVFMDSRTAFLTHAIIIMLCAAAVTNIYEFTIVQLCGGLVAIYTLRELSKRSQVFLAAIAVTAVEIIVYTAIQVMTNAGNFRIEPNMYYYFCANGVFLLLTYPMMYVVEKVFGFVSTVTLFELSDTNRSILRKLSEVAPGTFQHSITVSNIASEIAKRIGAKALLVRTGALYHDIGKMSNPVFFTENQMGVNPHVKLSETESAQIIISHVEGGLRMAEKANLPTIIADFIRTHHGIGMTKYFYIQYKNNHPDEEIDEKMFKYPGPNPFTTEQAILMMADTCEAAARSLQEYTQESITALVNRLLDGQLQSGYYRECPITYNDIATAKEVLIENLMSIYHTRIAYPELKRS